MFFSGSVKVKGVEGDVVASVVINDLNRSDWCGRFLTPVEVRALGSMIVDVELRDGPRTGWSAAAEIATASLRGNAPFSLVADSTPKQAHPLNARS